MNSTIYPNLELPRIEPEDMRSKVIRLFNAGESIPLIAAITFLQVATVEKILDDATKPFDGSSNTEFIKTLRKFDIVK
jgi:hypothetical protein